MQGIEVIKDLIRELVLYAVVSAFCMHLLPEKRYQKYARLVVGLIYICMILDAAGTLLNQALPVMQF